MTAGEGKDELTLQHSSSTLLDPEHFGFIFNPQGVPALTPRPGTPPAAPAVVNDWPQVRGVTTLEVVRE